jgi:hypothetical protein
MIEEAANSSFWHSPLHAVPASIPSYQNATKDITVSLALVTAFF